MTQEKEKEMRREGKAHKKISERKRGESKMLAREADFKRRGCPEKGMSREGCRVRRKRCQGWARRKAVPVERVAKGKRCQRQEIPRKETPNEKHAKTVDKDNKRFGYRVVALRSCG